MTKSADTDAQVDRAHLEGRIIESSLEHLEMTLSEQEPGLRDELRMLARTFSEYVGKLRNASGVASELARSRQAPAPPSVARDMLVG